MWHKLTLTLSPLTKLYSNNVEFKFNDIEHNIFLAIKKIGYDVLLYYPNFRERFIIHTDSSKIQLGEVISMVSVLIYWKEKNKL